MALKLWWLRVPCAVIFVMLLLGWVLPARADDERCFAETSYCIAGTIRTFWERNGGLPVFGLPIGPEQSAVVEGHSLSSQEFERNRLELHPENVPPYNLQLGRLGVAALSQQGRDWFSFPQSTPQPGCRFFAETGHQICGRLLERWRANGIEIDGRAGISEPESLALFGLPLSDAQTEVVQGQSYTVQWFERARFELHPENAAPNDVLLGLLGRELAQPPPAAPPPPVPPPLNPEQLTLGWGDPATLTDRRVRTVFPWAAIDSNSKLHLLYVTAEGSLFYTHDLSGALLEPQLVEAGVGANREPFAAIAAGPDGSVHLLYTRIGSGEVVYRRGVPNATGAAWGPPEIVAQGTRAFASQLAVGRDGTAHLVWIERRCESYTVLYRARRPDGSLGPASTPEGGCVYENRPRIAVTDAGAPQLVYLHAGDVHFASLHGDSWTVENVSRTAKNNAGSPSIATDGRGLFVVWEEPHGDDRLVFARFSPDGGQSWRAIRTVSAAGSRSTTPSAVYAATGGRYLVVWATIIENRRTYGEIWGRSFDTSGGALTRPERISRARGLAMLPVVAAGPWRAGVVWQTRDEGPWQVWYAGASFAA